MIIKSHIRGGYRAAADYLKSQGENENIRTVQLSDPDAKNLVQAFQNMWALAANGRSKKALHHISINPMKEECLTDAQVQKIVERCEQKYGYKPNDHQRIIVEHVKDGRQHFHVIWNRVSMTNGKVVKSGEHWKKSKQAAREVERELGLKVPQPKRAKLKPALSRFASGKTASAISPTILAIPSRPRMNIPRRSSVPVLGSGVGPSLVTARAAPIKSSPMGEEQRLDYIAACEGKITWKAYFQKWASRNDCYKNFT